MASNIWWKARSTPSGPSMQPTMTASDSEAGFDPRNPPLPLNLNPIRCYLGFARTSQATAPSAATTSVGDRRWWCMETSNSLRRSRIRRCGSPPLPPPLSRPITRSITRTRRLILHLTRVRAIISCSISCYLVVNGALLWLNDWNRLNRLFFGLIRLGSFLIFVEIVGIVDFFVSKI